MMRALAVVVVVLVVSLGVAFGGASPESARWQLPADTGRGQAPKLTRPLVVDGDLGEWTDAASIPISRRADVVFSTAPHVWHGPVDASMEVFCAWNDAGLGCAAVIADDDVVNDSPAKSLRNQDCFELHVDMRGPDELVNAPYSLGAWHLLVRPPLTPDAPEVVVERGTAVVEGLKVAGKRTPTGYVIEMLIPWLPGQARGAGDDVWVQFALDDYDRVDGKPAQRFLMNLGGIEYMSAGPRKFHRWKLVGALATGPQVHLGPLVSVDYPGILSMSQPVPIEAAVGRCLAARLASVHLTVRDWTGRIVVEASAPAVPMAEPWQDWRLGSLTWQADNAQDGVYAVQAEMLDAAGAVLGTCTAGVAVFVGATNEALQRLGKADLPRLSQTEPFRAAAWLSAAACLEHVKRAASLDDLAATTSAVQELNARLDLLEKGPSAAPAAELLSFLALAANPEAQVVVEYPEPGQAWVGFYCGAVPIAGALVRQFDKPEDAAKALRQDHRWMMPDLAEFTTVQGLPARVVKRDYAFPPVRSSEFDPARQALLVPSSRGWADVLEIERLSPEVRVGAVCILADCPEPARKAVETWAAQVGVPRQPFAESFGKLDLLVAGNVLSAEAKEQLTGRGFSTIATKEGFFGLEVAAGNRLIEVACPTQAGAERTLALVLARRPVTPAEVDELREMIVHELAPPSATTALPEGMHVFCGDVHMHTFYSDGRPSPVGRALEALYCNRDFIVITDHNTIDGARLAASLLREHGFAFPVIVGEEITTNWAHLNAYPLTALIAPTLTLAEMVQAAHAQGAVIQWNHPGYTASDFEASQYARGLTGTGLDAWEHVPIYYEAWKQAGTLPVITGSTDTHSDAFDFPQSSVIVASGTTGADVAAAVREGRVVLLSPSEPRMIYGPDAVANVVWGLLADGAKLREAKAQELKDALRHADVVGLLRASQPKP